jgi:hypothetical protein
MASTGGAIRTVLVDAAITAISSRIYRDIAPPETTYPYVTISDEITNQPVLLGDKQVIARNKQLRVNLWQLRTDENVALIDEIVAALDSVDLTANQYVFGVRVFDIQRQFDAEDDTILHAVTLNVIQRAP